MDKEDVAHVYNGILLSHKKKQNWVTCSEVDGLIDSHIEWSESERKKQIPYANTYIWNLKKKKKMGLPWWHSRWESACQCRGHGFEPWSGKIPHAVEQLGPWATTTEPACLEPVLCNKRGRDSERPAHHDEEWPPLAATRESPRTEAKTQHSQK